jgi:hypothetical protein
MASMAKEALDLFFRQYPAAREVRDYFNTVVKDSGMPWELPAMAIRDSNKENLILKFYNGSTWFVSLTIRAKEEE